ncbi:MAG: ABC transporter permease, partial [Clostridia bacterium]|nr:ABC transporter permease [Clostridia bacterium]
MKRKTSSRKLFFYASRQLWRRKRTYLAVFAVSVVLLALVMTALELFESYNLQSIEISSAGVHHAAIFDQTVDWSKDIAKDRGVASVWSIPHNSWLASSVDASSPGKVTVEDETIDALLGVRYLWGSPPGDGEIAVPLSLYRAENWLTAGDVNDLYFKATEMIYEPLRLSGIFTVSNIGTNYVFVSEETARRIDRGTGAREKYDFYLTCRHVSDRYAAHVVHRLWQKIGFRDTDAQSRAEVVAGRDPFLTRYEAYLNLAYLDNQKRYDAAPHLLWMLPVIAAASLVLAAFMIAWSRSHAPEFGILGSLGANKWDLCAIPAGQILLISLAASPPVVLLSALLSNLYLRTYNEVLSGVGFRFAVPWGKLAAAAALFVLLSTIFTYLGIAQLVSEPPFPLISGSYRGKMPFVRASSRFLAKMRDRVASLALLQAIRELRQEIITVAVSALIPTILGAVLRLLLVYRSSRSAALFHIGEEPFADCVVYALSEVDEDVEDCLPLTEAVRDDILSTGGVSSCMPFSWFGYANAKYTYQGQRMISTQPQVRLGED